MTKKIYPSNLSTVNVKTETIVPERIENKTLYISKNGGSHLLISQNFSSNLIKIL